MTSTNPNRVTLALIDSAGAVLEYGASFSLGHPSTRTDFGPGALPMIERYAKRAGHWTNYATWSVALVLSNDQGTYNYSRELAEKARDEAKITFASEPGSVREGHIARHILEDDLKDYTEELCGLESETDALAKVSPTMMAHQLLHAALAEVDWREIAENLLSELED